MKKRKNEGAALVAVLIGVLFITILASSLLYMSTMNYQMKSMRYFSTDNFYTAEFAMEDMLAQLRQKTMNHDSSVTTYAEIEELLGVTDNGTIKYYDCDKLRNLIHIDGRDVDGNAIGDKVVDGIAGVKVSTIYREKHANDNPWKDYGDITYSTYEETAEGIILHGIKITVTTLTPDGLDADYYNVADMTTYSDYESTISFDLEFAFPKYGTKRSGSVSDFSILSDTPVLVGGGNHLFTGSLYAKANGFSGKAPKSEIMVNGNTAFQVGEKAVCTVAGPFAFFQGDLVVDGVMFISGNCTVNGNIKLSSTATLYVAGDLKVRGNISNSSRLRQSGNVAVNCSTVDWAHYDDNYKDGLAGKLAPNVMHLYVGPDHNKVTGYGGFKDNLELTPPQFRIMCGDANVSDFCTVSTDASLNVDGEPVKAILSMASTNNTVKYNNALVIGFNNVNIHGEFINSTFVNLGRYPDGSSGFTQDIIEMDAGLQAHPNTWGHMDDKSYAAACDLLFCYGAQPDSNKSAQVTGTGYNVLFPKNGLVASNIKPDTASGTDTNAYKYVDGGTSFNLVRFDSTGKGYYRSENPVGGNYVNYIPYGNFFADNMGDIMDDFMSAGVSGSISTGSTSGFDQNAQPALIISHWTKE